MKPVIFIFFAFLMSADTSCNTDKQHQNALGSFRTQLRPYLLQIISSGIVESNGATRYLKQHATDRELMMLSHSEHPLLRATALMALTERPSIDQYTLVMNHLNDTAIVAVDYGEFGVEFRKVTDELIFNASWKDSASWKKTVDKVLTEHSYLRSAYIAARDISPDKKYYETIKKMALLKTDLERNSLDMSFYILQEALYGLAKFKQPKDISLIKDQLLKNYWRLNTTSFLLMKDFPNDAYLEVYEKYAKHELFDRICKNRIANEGDDFINSLAAYKNKRSAKLLQTLLGANVNGACSLNLEPFEHTLKYAIWENKCAAYTSMVEEIKPYVIAYEKKYSDFKLDLAPVEGTADLPKKIYWR
jgi:hypothetical protein